MKKIISAIMALLFIAPSTFSLQAQSVLIVKLRFYEGLKAIAHEPLTIVTSSYLRPLVTANIPSSVNPDEERRQIRRVFNLIDARLLTEADLVWASLRESATHVIRFDSKEINLVIKPSMLRMPEDSFLISKNQFNISVAEQPGQEKVMLLETDIIIPNKNVAIIGFESRDGAPYFLSLQVLPRPAGKKDASAAGTGGVVGGVIGGTVGIGGTRAVMATGPIKPPRLIKKVNPVYPEAARLAGLEGIVILEAETDVQGNVVRTEVLRSIPLLDQAAIDAVQQWKYEPAIINGKPTGIIFTVTVAFRLKD